MAAEMLAGFLQKKISSSDPKNPVSYSGDAPMFSVPPAFTKAPAMA